MSIYKSVVNDHGTFRGMYSYSNDTLDVIETPSVEKPGRSSLRKILFCLSPRSRHHHHRLSRSPGIHRFRIWLNNKPILAFPQLSTEDSKSTGQASDSFQTKTDQKQPPVCIHQFKKHASTVDPSKERPCPQTTCFQQGLAGFTKRPRSKERRYSTSTLTDYDDDASEGKIKRSKGSKSNLNLRDFYSPNVLFDGPTAIIQ
ncbi:hypothetical protein C6P43_000927 [Kluyveromyces marxianus]|nr:hypothetical protein C6P43_000927 [Kluyveromyces marxianus]